jgi:plastocyanin
MLAAVCASAAGAAQDAGGRTHSVTIDGVQFHPEELTVHLGDRIVWTNKDPFPHTVTAVNKLFDSHNVAPEASWTYVASKRGEYPYGCTLHPTMKGKITVQ